MQFTPANIDAIFYTFDTRYQSAYTAAPTYYDKFASVLPSSARENRYLWMDRVPKMREWLGERVIQNASARSYLLGNRDWELTLELDRNVIADDQVGVFNPTVDMMGLEAKLWPDQLFLDVLENGNLTDALHACHDGQPFFSANHPIDMDASGSAVQSNLFAATALNATNFASVRQAMIAYQARDGRPFGVMPDLLMVPPALEWTARQFLATSFIAPSVAFGMNAANTVQSNPLMGAADLLVHPYLAASYSGGSDIIWYLMQTKGIPVRPFIFQLRLAPQFVYKNRLDDDNLFLRRKFLYGVDSRGAAGYSLYFYCARASA